MKTLCSLFCNQNVLYLIIVLIQDVQFRSRADKYLIINYYTTIFFYHLNKLKMLCQGGININYKIN